MVICIKDEGLRTFGEVMERAERFAEARRSVKFSRGNIGSSSGNRPQQQVRRRDSNPKNPVSPSRLDRPPLSAVGMQMRRENNSTTKGVGTCYYCGDTGHYKRYCPKLERDKRRSASVTTNRERCALASVPALGATCEDDQGPVDSTCSVFLSLVEGRLIDSIRDSGATCMFVDESIVPSDAERGGTCQVVGVEEAFNVKRPYVKINVATPYFKGDVWAVALKKPAYTLLVGNQVHFCNGARGQVSTELPSQVLAGVTTRAKAKERPSVLKPIQEPVTDDVALHADRETINRLQAKDPTLQHLRASATRGMPSKSSSSRSSGYCLIGGLLYRTFWKSGEVLNPLTARKHFTPKNKNKAEKNPTNIGSKIIKFKVSKFKGITP